MTILKRYNQYPTQRTRQQSSSTFWRRCQKFSFPLAVLIVVVTTTVTILIAVHFVVFNDLVPSSSSSSSSTTASTTKQTNTRQEVEEFRSQPKSIPRSRPASVEITNLDETSWNERRDKIASWRDQQQNAKNAAALAALECQYHSISELSTEQTQPQANHRHMVTPPRGGKLSLVCCETTKGPLSIVAHHAWAPLGAARFMEMVTSGYFNHGVPMMRCIPNFLCQFGLSAHVDHLKDFDTTFEDDPNWLPEGPTHRENALGVKRFAQGYLAYAGSGNHSRNKQLIVALQPNGPLAGGSPWEVPWGELVGDKSFDTLSKIYTGYGDQGPSQGKLHNHGMTEDMKKAFPDLDYIQKCQLMDEYDFAELEKK
jgi:cyclophilin family peptidyl-prolyl cis-trans isomerase